VRHAASLGLGVALLLAAATPDVIRAQDAALVRVEQLTSEGRYSSARDELAAWFEAAWEASAREDRQRALWLRGRLTVDGGMAERDYRRLVVEHPGGQFSDDALLRLAQLAWARSDADGALRHLRMLTRDYPESEHRAEALELIARLSAGAPAGSGATGAGGPAPGATGAGMLAPAVAPQTSAAPANAPRIESGAVPERFDGMPFTIELGAFSTEPPAQTIAAAAIAAGVQVRVVGLPGSDLIHVRTGAFFSQMEAQARALELRVQGLPAAVSDDRAEEEPR
jgi:hypothetical protein